MQFSHLTSITLKRMHYVMRCHFTLHCTWHYYPFSFRAWGHLCEEKWRHDRTHLDGNIYPASLSSLWLIQRTKIHCNGAPLRMTFWMRSAPMHWQWICIREITMRWQGRSSHPNTSTAGSQLSWATSHLLHKSTASWQHLTIYSCKPKDLCCCSQLSRLWFDESSCT